MAGDAAGWNADPLSPQMQGTQACLGRQPDSELLETVRMESESPESARCQTRPGPAVVLRQTGHGTVPAARDGAVPKPSSEAPDAPLCPLHPIWFPGELVLRPAP